VKFLVHFEFCPDDLEMALENIKLDKETDKHLKYLIPLQRTGQGNCFTIIEITDLNQYRNAIKSYFPKIKVQYTPCNDIPEWVKQFMKSK